MKYRYLGDTGLAVSELCFGVMTFGGGASFLGAPDRDWAEFGTVDDTDASRLVRIALDSGINFFDTADVYKNGLGEAMLGASLGGERDRVVIGTKGRWRVTDDPNDIGATRHHLIAAVERSLRNLRTDYIDIYHIHGPDPRTSPEETLRALDDLISAGKIRYIGVSNHAAWQFMKALAVSDRRHLARYVCYQGYYNIGARELEREIVPMCVDQRVAITAWSPLGGGFFTGKYRRGQELPPGSRLAQRTPAESAPLTAADPYDIIDVMDKIAVERGVTVAQIALNWLLRKPGVTSLVIGATKPQQLEDNLRALEWELTDAEMAQLDGVSDLPPVYPYWHIRDVAGDRRLPEDVYG